MIVTRFIIDEVFCFNLEIVFEIHVFFQDIPNLSIELILALLQLFNHVGPREFPDFFVMLIDLAEFRLVVSPWYGLVRITIINYRVVVGEILTAQKKWII